MKALAGSAVPGGLPPLPAMGLTAEGGGAGGFALASHSLQAPGPPPSAALPLRRAVSVCPQDPARTHHPQVRDEHLHCHQQLRHGAVSRAQHTVVHCGHVAVTLAEMRKGR